MPARSVRGRVERPIPSSTRCAGSGRCPLAVRSSSLLEDALYRPFAGVYATKMIPNNHFDPDGLASAFVLLYPDEARARRRRVVDVASAGDFAT